MVGRQAELDHLRGAFSRTVRDRACHLFTLLGEAGVGKSRLAAEFVASTSGATVVRGRCLSYGEGVTYLPVVEIVKQLVGNDVPARLSQLTPDEAVHSTIRALLDEQTPASSTDETAWAVRKLLEAAAIRNPLVVVFDDIHWGEPTFLDLVEHVADWTREAPILLLCLARPDLLQSRPTWGGGKLNASAALLEPLSAEETDELMERLLGTQQIDDTLRSRIRRTAEGNPLFVEQMLALLAEARTGEVTVPPTIQALLAARLDQLDPNERAVLERGAVQGRIFHRGAVRALAPDEPHLDTRLMALVRKDLVRAHASELSGEDAFRFRHQLIRDAAYDALPKQERAELHQLLADWLDARHDHADELVGYHLEQAHGYRRQLGQLDDPDRPLATRAGGYLGAAGRRALSRGDVAAATNLLGRAIALLPDGDDLRTSLLPDFGAALREAGELGRAEAVLAEALESARRGNDRVAELAAVMQRTALHLLDDPRAPETEQLVSRVEEFAPILEELGQDRLLAEAWALIGTAASLWKGRHERGEAALERALVHARRAGDRQHEAAVLGRLAFAAAWGPTPVPAAIVRCAEILELAHGDRLVEAAVLRYAGCLQARQGRFDAARVSARCAREGYEELGMRLMAQTARAFGSGDIEILAGDYEAAERELRTAYDALETMGERGYLSSVAAFLARALFGQERFDEALEAAQSAESSAATYDLWSQVIARGPHAKVLARRGDHENAERVAREAVEIVSETDALELHGTALLDLADVLTLAGGREQALAKITEALTLFERKDATVLIRSARGLLEERRSASYR